MTPPLPPAGCLYRQAGRRTEAEAMSISLDDLFAVLAAIVLAAVGGEAFPQVHPRGRHPPAGAKRVVAITLAAFATSSPELTVSSVAALAGQPQIGLGDALGSNVVNIALIFGLALLYGAVPTRRDDFGAISTSRWRCRCSPWYSSSTGSSHASRLCCSSRRLPPGSR
jgi:Ca2+/Na+ antiporter